MSISENIKILRERYDITQKELAEIAGVSNKAISTWEVGSFEPRMGAIQRMADYFGLKKGNLIDDGGMDLIGIEKRGHKIPVLGKVPAGIPVEAIQDVVDYEEIPEKMFRSGDYFGLMIKGDSMEPRIREGDVVIVKQQCDVDSGKVAIILINGCDATCKKLVKHEDGISLVSYNTKYSPKFYTNNEVKNLPVQIIGRVVELRAKF